MIRSTKRLLGRMVLTLDLRSNVVNVLLILLCTTVGNREFSSGRLKRK